MSFDQIGCQNEKLCIDLCFSLLLEDSGLSTEGLFRRNGNPGRQRNLVAECHEAFCGNQPQLCLHPNYIKVEERFRKMVIDGDGTMFDKAGVIKDGLRMYCKEWIRRDKNVIEKVKKFTDGTDDQKKKCIDSLFGLVNSDPDNYQLFVEVIQKLNMIAQSYHLNLMNSLNLSIVFSPIFIIAAPSPYGKKLKSKQMQEVQRALSLNNTVVQILIEHAFQAPSLNVINNNLDLSRGRSRKGLVSKSRSKSCGPAKNNDRRRLPKTEDSEDRRGGVRRFPEYETTTNGAGSRRGGSDDTAYGVVATNSFMLPKFPVNEASGSRETDLDTAVMETKAPLAKSASQDSDYDNEDEHVVQQCASCSPSGDRSRSFDSTSRDFSSDGHPFSSFSSNDNLDDREKSSDHLTECDGQVLTTNKSHRVVQDGKIIDLSEPYVLLTESSQNDSNNVSIDADQSLLSVFSPPALQDDSHSFVEPLLVNLRSRDSTRSKTTAISELLSQTDRSMPPEIGDENSSLVVASRSFSTNTASSPALSVKVEARRHETKINHYVLGKDSLRRGQPNMLSNGLAVNSRGAAFQRRRSNSFDPQMLMANKSNLPRTRDPLYLLPDDMNAMFSPIRSNSIEDLPLSSHRRDLLMCSLSSGSPMVEASSTSRSFDLDNVEKINSVVVDVEKDVPERSSHVDSSSKIEEPILNEVVVETITLVGQSNVNDDVNINENDSIQKHNPLSTVEECDHELAKESSQISNVERSDRDEKMEPSIVNDVDAICCSNESLSSKEDIIIPQLPNVTYVIESSGNISPPVFNLDMPPPKRLPMRYLESQNFNSKPESVKSKNETDSEQSASGCSDTTGQNGDGVAVLNVDDDFKNSDQLRDDILNAEHPAKITHNVDFLGRPSVVQLEKQGIVQKHRRIWEQSETASFSTPTSTTDLRSRRTFKSPLVQLTSTPDCRSQQGVNFDKFNSLPKRNLRAASFLGPSHYASSSSTAAVPPPLPDEPIATEKSTVSSPRPFSTANGISPRQGHIEHVKAGTTVTSPTGIRMFAGQRLPQRFPLEYGELENGRGVEIFRSQSLLVTAGESANSGVDMRKRSLVSEFSNEENEDDDQQT